jgi:hypothetical protein
MRFLGNAIVFGIVVLIAKCVYFLFNGGFEVFGMMLADDAIIFIVAIGFAYAVRAILFTLAGENT